MTSAGAEVGPPDVDAAIWAELAFPSGATGRIESSMVQPDEEISLTITGTKGEIVVDNPLAPQNGNLVTVRTEAWRDVRADRRRGHLRSHASRVRRSRRPRVAVRHHG